MIGKIIMKKNIEKKVISVFPFPKTGLDYENMSGEICRIDISNNEYVHYLNENNEEFHEVIDDIKVKYTKWHLQNKCSILYLRLRKGELPKLEKRIEAQVYMLDETLQDMLNRNKINQASGVEKSKFFIFA